MDFACIVLFLAIYHLKPQEWSPIFSAVRFVPLVMLASVATLFFRERQLKLRDFFRTPHDWAIYAFFGWVVIASPTPYDTFTEFLNRLVFYVVVVQTLTNWERIQKFLGWWTAMLAITAFLALAGEYFWDPLGSYDATHGPMKGRLVLNLSMVNNPNALAHTLAPCLSLIYYFCIWKRPLFMKEAGLFALILPLWAIFLTGSKGGFIASAAVITATLTFGRPKIVQGLIVLAIVAGGLTTLRMLPRMDELKSTQTDEGIQGRVRAFTYGYEYYETAWKGIGQGQFIPRLVADHKYRKASHSTYNQIGAELGKPGMFLFLLIMWLNLRTVLFVQTRTVEQERVRRILFVLVVSYGVSGWIVDFAYRAPFFLFTGAIAAFHRHLHGLWPEKDREEEEDEETARRGPSWRPKFLPSPAGNTPELVLATAAPPAALAEPATASPAPRPVWSLKRLAFPWQKPAPDAAPGVDIALVENEPPEKPIWNRIGLMDLLIVLAAMKVVDFLWNYAIHHV